MLPTLHSALDKGAAMVKVSVVALGAAITLWGCAVEMVNLGTPREEVLAKYGAPTRVVPIASGTRLQYSRQPVGQTAIMVDLDAAGRVVSVRQVLNENDFARVAVGQWTREVAEREFGRPAFTSHVASWTGDILVYRWLDLSRTDMFFYVYLDPSDVVQRVGQGMEFRDVREPKE
jgi:hypothetical protein